MPTSKILRIVEVTPTGTTSQDYELDQAEIFKLGLNLIALSLGFRWAARRFGLEKKVE